MKNKIMFFLGFFFIALGIVGIVLPLLPTTPFLILAAACFYRSSPKMHTWITEHKIFGEPIKKFQTEKIISIKTKITALSMLWLFILYSTFWVVSLLWVKVFLIFIAVGVSFYILSFKSL